MFLRNMTQKVKSELSDLFPNHTIEVLGAALPTHDSWLSTIKYDYLRGKVNADYVVIYHGINDLWANNVRSHKYFRDDYAYISPFHRRSWVLDRSLIARHIYKTIWNLERWLWNQTGRGFYIFNGASYETVRTLTSNVASIIQKAREDGAEPILMTFAWHLADGYTEEKFVARELGYVADQVPEGCCGVNVWGPVEYVTEGLVRHNEALRTLGRSENVTMIDQHSLLSLEIANFQDICHFSELGAQRFARNLAEAIATHHTQAMSADQANSISDRT